MLVEAKLPEQVRYEEFEAWINTHRLEEVVGITGRETPLYQYAVHHLGLPHPNVQRMAIWVKQGENIPAHPIMLPTWAQIFRAFLEALPVGMGLTRFDCLRLLRMAQIKAAEEG